MEFFTLNNGVKMPVIGLGTFPMNRFNLMKVVCQAVDIKNGSYSSFDTSAAYNNERWLGFSQKVCKKRRSELFITTKLSNEQQRCGNVRQALTRSLELLKTSYVDLYLMHWPNPHTYLESWRQMEILYKEGMVRAIGICNFHQHHIESLLEIANVVPMINQIELHPLLSQKKLLEFCKMQRIQVEAYSPTARMYKGLIEHPILVRLAKKYDKTVNQIIFRWDYQCGVIAIPKTCRVKRLRENINIFDFELSREDMIAIDSINKNFRVRHNPDNCDFLKL